MVAKVYKVLYVLNSCMTLIGVHEMHGRMQLAILLAHDPFHH